jgi:hypothetical protein
VVRFSFVVMCLVGCGKVESNIDASMGPGDARVDATPDADPCARFEAPPGARPIDSQFCFDALGYNPGATPQSMTLTCPGPGGTPGTYGLVLRPLTQMQNNGCPATTPVTRILAPMAANAIAQTGTSHALTIAAGDRLRVRLACASEAGPACRGDVQITGRKAAGQPIVLIYPPGGGFQTVQGTEVVDVDVPMPVGLVGATTRIAIISGSNGSGTTDLLFENAHLVQ